MEYAISPLEKKQHEDGGDSRFMKLTPDKQLRIYSKTKAEVKAHQKSLMIFPFKLTNQKLTQVNVGKTLV